jgi:lipocalin
LVVNECRDKTVDGDWTNITASLFDEDLDVPGRWLTQIGKGSPANYTVIAIKRDEYSVEYDCKTSNLGVTNYCIHVLSRTPTLDENTFKELIEMAESMGLNPQQLPYTMTVQEGC